MSHKTLTYLKKTKQTMKKQVISTKMHQVWSATQGIVGMSIYDFSL